MYNLRFEIQSYWQAGSGRGGGALVDTLVQKNVHDLPFLPGRTIKGLLRDAVYRAEEWGHLPIKTTHCLFGSDAPVEGMTRLETEAGALAFSDAVLPPDVSMWLSHPDTDSQLRQALFRQISATAVEAATSCAIDKSLRTIEVTVPLTLTSSIMVLNDKRLNTIDWGNGREWLDCFEPCLKLIRAVGASRSRGLGRVSVKLEK